MNFTKVDLLSSGSDQVISMSFQDPTLSSPYVLKALLGLDIDEVSTRYYGKGVSGKPFYAMDVGGRTVVIQVVLNPNYALGQTVKSLRANVYRAISSTRTGALTLRFLDGANSIATISGFVQKVEAEHFSSSPELKITLDCSREPLLRSEQSYSVPVNFSNPVQAIVEDDVSEAPHGVYMELLCTNPVFGISFYDAVPIEWQFVIRPLLINNSSGFLSGDILRVSSEEHNRFVYIVRNGQEFQLANYVEPGSVWPIIFPGTNIFNRTANFNWVSINYRHAYWGI